jgi:hypothetical protein
MAGQGSATTTKSIFRFIRVLNFLGEWYKYNVSDCRETLWWSISGQDGETYLWYSCISAANCLTHYWAFWIICVTNIIRLRTDHPHLLDCGITVDNQSPESQYISDKVIERSTWILQSVEFFIQDEMKLYGVASIFLPLQTACSVLEIGDRYAGNESCRRHERIIKKINRSGYRDILMLQPVLLN